MDKLDSILLAAWNRVSARVRRDRVSALKRSRRRFGAALTQPMREWCLVIRASDTRINSVNAIVEGFEGAEDATRQVGQDDCLEAGGLRFSEGAAEDHCDSDWRDPLANQLPHTVTLDGKLIRELTKPVVIPWPGVPYEEAAKRLGRTKELLNIWVREGALKVAYWRGFRYPGEMRTRTARPKATKSGRREKVWENGRPYLWSPVALDPNNCRGEAPHRVWGTLWKWQWEQLPEDYELEVQRVPRFRESKRGRKFSGWHFVCPGRLNENGEYKGCGRECRFLYAPQSVWTLPQALRDELGGEDGEGLGFDMPEDSRLAGAWYPGLSDPIKNAGRGGRSFACKECWGVTNGCWATYDGWNRFVTQISGGLLRGRDVPRPEDICPIRRKKRVYQQRKRSFASSVGRRFFDNQNMGSRPSIACGDLDGRTLP